MPTEISVTRKSSAEADVKWKDTSSDEWGFRVERSTSDVGPWVKVGEVGAGATSLADVGLDGATTYFYGVRAYNANGYSDRVVSSKVSATTLGTGGGGGADATGGGGGVAGGAGGGGGTTTTGGGGGTTGTGGGGGAANVPPSVTLAGPTAAQTAPANVVLNANATDSDGTVARVEFYEGTTKLGTATVSPYSYTVANVAAGAHTYTARAIDNLNAATSSAPVTVMVQAPGQQFAYSVTSMTLINADNGQAVAGMDPIAANATISYAAVGTMNLSIRCNTTGTIGSVTFGLDGNAAYHTENNAPYAMQGDNGMGTYTPIAPALAAGAHAVTCTPFDAAAGAGNAGGPLTVNFTIAN